LPIAAWRLFPRTPPPAIYQARTHSTPHPLALLALGLLGVYATGFAVTRVHMFQFAYATQQQQRDNDKWLLSQCSDDAFYHNMKHHSDICEQVSHESQRSLWLAAVDHVVRNTHACGYQSCLSILEDSLAWVLSRGMLVAGGAALLLVVTPTLTLPFYRMHMLGGGHRDRIDHRKHEHSMRYSALGPLDM